MEYFLKRLTKMLNKLQLLERKIYMNNYNLTPMVIITFIVALFFSVVWIPVFIIFYPLYLIGKSLSFMDQSEQVSHCGQTKYSVFLFFLYSIAVLPYNFAWAFVGATNHFKKQEKKKISIQVNFEDKDHHGNIDREKFINLVSHDEVFQTLFNFREKIDKDSYLNFFDYNQEEIYRYEKKVVWLYWSDYNHDSIIGITKNKGAIFCIDSNYDKTIISKNFYELPFLMFLHESDSTIGQVPWRARHGRIDMNTYEKLKLYCIWLEENNIKVKKKYIDMLN